jgi:hypothetical protein
MMNPFSCNLFFWSAGAEEVTTNQVSKKVTVTGDIDPDFVLSCAQSHKPNSTFWYTSDWQLHHWDRWNYIPLCLAAKNVIY